MTRRFPVFRPFLLIVAAGFLVCTLIAGGHVHQQATDGAVNGTCQLCSLGQARVDVNAALPLLGSLAFLGWLIVQPPGASPSVDRSFFASPRAPPLQ